MFLLYQGIVIYFDKLLVAMGGMLGQQSNDISLVAMALDNLYANALHTPRDQLIL
jgi:hypothetical protein